VESNTGALNQMSLHSIQEEPASNTRRLSVKMGRGKDGVTMVSGGSTNYLKHCYETWALIGNNHLVLLDALYYHFA
jgi:hypothetical protein